MAIEFVVNLLDQVSAPAKKAATALTATERAAKTLKGSMTALQNQITKAQALGDTAKVQKLTATLGKYDAALKKLPPTHKHAEETALSFGDKMKVVGNAVLTSIVGMGEAFKSLKSGDFAGVVENLTQSFAGLAKMLDLVYPGAGAAAAALIQVGGAFAAVTVGLIQKGAELALEFADVKEKLTATFEAMGNAPGAGAATLKMLGSVSDELGVTRASLVETTKSLMAMGITDQSQLRDQLKATAAVAAVMGDTGVAAYNKLISKTQEAVQTGAKFKVSDKQIASFKQMGFSIDDVAKQMGTTSKKLRDGLTSGRIDAQKFQDTLSDVAKNKFGSTLEVQAMSLTNLWAKFKENIGRLFEDVDVKPFLESMKGLLSIFGSDKASGKAMKAGLTSTFNAIFSALGKLVFKMEGWFLNIEIWVLKALIWLKPFVKKWDEMNHKFGIVSKFITGLKVLAVVVAALGAALVAAFAIALIPVVAVVAAFTALETGVILLYGTIVQAIPKMTKALGDWASSAAEAAGNFVDGLVLGFENGITKVTDAAKNLGKSAMNAVKDVLGIHSPSRVMLNMGMMTGAGFAGGLSASTGHVASAGAGMAAGSVAGAAGSVNRNNYSSASYGSSSSSNSTSNSKHTIVNVGGIHIEGGGKGATEITEEAVTLIFERIALTQGL